MISCSRTTRSTTTFCTARHRVARKRLKRCGVASFVRLTQAAAQSWGAQNRVLGFVPDHGGHIDPHTGKGTHGLDMLEDMDVQHFYGVFVAGPPRAESARSLTPD
jgi:hypothetical protein